MKSLFFLSFFCSTLSYASSKKECLSKFPSLSGLINAVDPLKNASQGKSKLKFSELVKRAQEVEKLANRQKSKIQALGCAEILHDIEPCLYPIDWNCKNQPFGIDFDFLSSVKKSAAEEKAFASYQLYKSVHLLKVCCNELGCVENGVGLPNVIFEKNRLQALIQLAAANNEYSSVALKSLEMTVSDLKQAQCSCPPPKEQDIQRIMKDIKETLASLDKKSKRAKQTEKTLTPLISFFEKGFPTDECSIPGE